MLMISKSAKQYKLLFESLINFAKENEIELNLNRIITDFKQVTINMSHSIFLGVINKSCFFYLSQAGWRKIQHYELADTVVLHII